MVRQIIWTKKAQKDRAAMFVFFNNRNKSFNYSNKLNDLFNEILKLLCRHPLIGKRSNRENVRVKVLKDFFNYLRDH
jgi:hypothetical protein